MRSAIQVDGRLVATVGVTEFARRRLAQRHCSAESIDRKLNKKVGLAHRKGLRLACCYVVAVFLSFFRVTSFSKRTHIPQKLHATGYGTVIAKYLGMSETNPGIIRSPHAPMELCGGIECTVNRVEAGKPMQNGFIERSDCSYRQAVLDMYVFTTLNEVREQTEMWLKEYNEDPPHDALGDMTPGNFY